VPAIQILDRQHALDDSSNFLAEAPRGPTFPQAVDNVWLVWKGGLLAEPFLMCLGRRSACNAGQELAFGAFRSRAPDETGETT
jgi:hypothetical protein